MCLVRLLVGSSVQQIIVPFFSKAKLSGNFIQSSTIRSYVGFRNLSFDNSVSWILLETMYGIAYRYLFQYKDIFAKGKSQDNINIKWA